MHTAVTLFLFAVSVVIIIKGGDWFVDAATWFAEISGIPKLIVGATVVSIATTLPEMLVSMLAAGQGKVDMSIGNAVGSVTANIGLIMALAFLFLPSVIRRKDYLLKSLLMLGAAALIAGFGLTGEIGLVPSLLLLAIFAAAMYENVHEALAVMHRRGALSDAEGTEAPADGAAVSEPLTRRVIVVNILKFLIGTVMIVCGAQLLVNSGSELAKLAGVSERVISVTLVAVGTSLPELITTLSAIAKKQPSLSAGNIIGANIFDLTLIMPLSCLVSGKALPVATRQMMLLDLPAALLLGLVALVPALITKRFRRWQGFVLLGLYAVYVYLSCFVSL